MPKLTKEEFSKAEAALLAEEQATKRKWCALKGHKWDLPQPNPLNFDMLECDLVCGRCSARAKLAITDIKDTP
jgi:hypothetical protein